MIMGAPKLVTHRKLASGKNAHPFFARKDPWRGPRATASMRAMLLGVDTGGTFTDFAYYDPARGLRFHKVLSTPDDPGWAIRQGVEEMGLNAEALQIVHGSTVATNAILERRGVRTLFVTNRGMEDLLRIGRQQRPHLYRLTPPEEPGFFDAVDVLGVSGRVYADGSYEDVAAEDLARLARLSRNYEAVAICTLFCWLDPAQELALGAALRGHPFVTLSHRLLAECGEYERAATTFVNASVGPLVQRYLQRLQERLAPCGLWIMHSAGGLMPVDEAGEQAARLVLSGPAGGLVAACEVGRALDCPRLLSFDMGGTSTDVALIDGQPTHTACGAIADIPLALPMLDIHTVGAGGGSLAWRDAAGLLQVGPRSAGADPGPICYGRGGAMPTVTDAHVFLGRIPEDTSLAGSMPLDVAACRQRMREVARQWELDAEALARGIVDLAEEAMVGALRRVSVERGVDVRDFALFCFGGAGGLHACALAEKLGMCRVIVPVASGAFSALGMLLGRRQADLSRSCLLPADGAWTRLREMRDDLLRQLAARMPADAEIERIVQLDVRYRGQGTPLTLPWTDDAERLRQDFVRAHRQRYGHALDLPLEITAVRARLRAPRQAIHLPALPTATSPARPRDHCLVLGHGRVPRHMRAKLRPGHHIEGPALITESTATLWLPPSWRLSVSENGHLLLEGKGSAEA